jgi:hypothetical protein
MAGVVMAADPVKSGLATGEFVPAFNVKDCTGPNEGKTLCYRTKRWAPARKASSRRSSCSCPTIRTRRKRS